jgi:hypothetical protein
MKDYDYGDYTQPKYGAPIYRQPRAVAKSGAVLKDLKANLHKKH